MKKETLRDFYGRIIGTVETDERTGNKIARDFYGRVLGSYDKRLDLTRDFYNRVVGHGDQASALVWEAENANKKK